MVNISGSKTVNELHCYDQDKYDGCCVVSPSATQLSRFRFVLPFCLSILFLLGLIQWSGI
jgi:hypothetical protein